MDRRIAEEPIRGRNYLSGYATPRQAWHPFAFVASEPVVDLDLRPERRDQLVAGLCAELEALIPGSSTHPPRFTGRPDRRPHSDIDVCWAVADETFTAR
jgi:hypothetical protein